MIAMAVHQYFRGFCLFVATCAICLSSVHSLSAEEMFGRDRLVEYLIPITGDEPRSVDLEIAFELGSAKLAEKARGQLNELIAALKSERLKGLKVDILGHTDALGSRTYNQKLSEERARAVVEYLVSGDQLDRARFTAKGLGETQLLEDIDPVHPAHRRVEVVVHPPIKEPSNTEGSDEGYSTID